MEKLKPCPFCGDKSVVRCKQKGYVSSSSTIKDGFAAGCPNCEIWTPIFESNVFMTDEGSVCVERNGSEYAVEAWNRRTGDENK